jgi:hypothetical protein
MPDTPAVASEEVPVTVVREFLRLELAGLVIATVGFVVSKVKVEDATDETTLLVSVAFAWTVYAWAVVRFATANEYVQLVPVPAEL